MTFNFNVGGLTPQDALPGGGGGSTATNIRNMGIMGVNSTSTTSIYPVEKNTQGAFYGEYTNINTLRLWNRALSAEEIKQNYENDKKRFG